MMRKTLFNQFNCLKGTNGICGFRIKTLFNGIKVNCFSEENSVKEQLIKLSMLNVSKYGFTDLSIKLAANELGYSNSLYGLLPKGPIEIIHYTMDSWNEKLKKDIEQIQNDSELTADEKILKALKLRLSYESPLVNNWSQAMKLGMNLTNIKSTLDRLITMTNLVSSLEDNKDTTGLNDSSLFKKYLILKIFILSELHLMTDRSPNYDSTWDFLNKLYFVNFNIYSSLRKFTMVNSAIVTLIKYSLISFAPYDFSKVDEMLKLRQEEESLSG